MASTHVGLRRPVVGVVPSDHPYADVCGLSTEDDAARGLHAALLRLGIQREASVHLLLRREVSFHLGREVVCASHLHPLEAGHQHRVYLNSLLMLLWTQRQIRLAAGIWP